MVTIDFKLTEAGRVEFDLPAPMPLVEVLRRCAARTDYTCGSYIAVRKGRVVTGGDMVEDQDHIDIFPALSGG